MLDPQYPWLSTEPGSSSNWVTRWGESSLWAVFQVWDVGAQDSGTIKTSADRQTDFAVDESDFASIICILNEVQMCLSGDQYPKLQLAPCS